MNKILKKTIIGIGIISAIGIIGYLILFSLVWYQFNVGCGLDDGPFEAIKIEKCDYSENIETYNLKEGKLILDNRHDTLSPIITYLVANKVKWTLDTDVRNTSGYETCRISSINNLKIEEHSKELNLTFYAVWTYGAESGSMNIEKSNGENKFCLSW